MNASNPQNDPAPQLPPIRRAGRLRALALWICISLTGCITAQTFDIPKHGQYLIGERNYSFAIYNRNHRLMTHPLEDLIARVRWQEAMSAVQQSPSSSTTVSSPTKDLPPITDIYIMSHGWNYDAVEAVANYHGYMKETNELLCPQSGNPDERRPDARDQTRDHCPSTPFRPYFIFITWTSATRPLQDLAKGLLPFELDNLIRPATWFLDTFAVHPFTIWQQSLNAAANALGQHLAERYHNVRRETIQYGTRMTYYDELGLGEDLPVSALIYELIKYREELCSDGKGMALDCKKEGAHRPLQGTRLHLVGHSYGAKLIAFAGMEALRRWVRVDCLSEGATDGGEEDLCKTLRGTLSKDNPNELVGEFGTQGRAEEVIDNIYALQRGQRTDLIESLVLFNPAFQLSELSYSVKRISSDHALTPSVLRLIPRKAIVYSKLDYANGIPFATREFVLSAESLKYSVPSFLSWPNKSAELGRPETRNALMDVFGGALWGVGMLAFSAIQTKIVSVPEFLFSLPDDFAYHLDTNSPFYFLPSHQEIGGLHWMWQYPLNSLDFFLPLHLFPLVDEDHQGLFRLTRAGLGKTGLEKARAGRPYLAKKWGFPPESFKAPTFGPQSFCDFTRQPETKFDDVPSNETRLSIYNFDSKKAFDSTWWPPEGAHSDLREEDPPGCSKRAPNDSKRKRSTNFVFNFTKTNFLKSEALKSP